MRLFELPTALRPWIILACCLPALLLAAAAARAEGDAERGRLKAEQCMGCHNIPGYRAAFPETYRVPRIQGQSSAYIEYALNEYARGNRYPPHLNKLASMPAIASSLTPEDIADLAAYYSSLKL